MYMHIYKDINITLLAGEDLPLFFLFMKYTCC